MAIAPGEQVAEVDAVEAAGHARLLLLRILAVKALRKE